MWSSRTGVDGAIVMATRATRSSPFVQVSPIAALNSGSDDDDPELSKDGLTIVFSSNRSANFDLYVSTRACQ